MSTHQQDPIESVALAVREAPSNEIVRADDFMPLMTIEQAVQRKRLMNQFISQILVEATSASDGDYGMIPGSTKNVLKKPGAEKLCSIFGLAPQYVEDKTIEDWTGEAHGGEPLFYYSYRCSLSRGGRFMGEAIGSCNSWETKYRYRWVRLEDIPSSVAPDDEAIDRLPTRGGTRKLFEPNFALEKRETEGKYGKPAEYWQRWDDAIQSGTAHRAEKKMGTRVFQGFEMQVDETQYRIPNPDVADVINTCQKMAQKRALVAAVLVVTNCSDAFTQDIDDFEQPHGATPTAEPQGAATRPTEAAQQPAPQATPAKRTPASGKPDPSVPPELVKVFERLEKDPSQFTQAAKMMEDACVDALGQEAGLKAYDEVADAFYTAHPNGTQDIRELKAVLLALHKIVSNAPARA